MSTSVTPRLRISRIYSPTHDMSLHSDAGPSRLPDFSQLVNLSLKDMQITDDNIYASDVPIEPTRKPSPASEANSENPAAVLRALLSRLPNKDESATHHPNGDQEHNYLSERESDYDVETASATTSVAQSSLKTIFSRALREPGETPRKDKSHLRRSSIGSIDLEGTPHVSEARVVKGKRRSLSDDEVDSANNISARPRTRFRKTSHPLTQDFLRERFGKSSDSPVKQQESTDNENGSPTENFVPPLNSSQTSPPIATSTPQRSLMSLNQSRFNSNLLDQDSEMQNAFDALESSLDNASDRSLSPIPTLHIEPEPEPDVHTPDEATDSETNGRGSNLPTSLQSTPRFNAKDLPSDSPSTAKASRWKSPGNLPASMQSTPRFNAKDVTSDVPSTVKASHSKLPVYDKHDSLGEQSMSLSLPVGHINLQPNGVDFSRSTNGANGSLSRPSSVLSLRPSSPMPDHRRPHSPIDAVYERERNWNKPQPVRHERSSSRLSHHSSLTSIRSASPIHVPNGSLAEREPKTPKPPGAWATPGPASRKFDESDYPEDNGDRSQLLTPVDSLSRGSGPYPKTPVIPGGWAPTPATRKSVLKVRFDPQRSEVKDESELYAQGSGPEPRDEDPNPSEVDSPSPQNVSLPSPRSLRKPKASIRVLDAFGREETPTSSPKKESNASRNGIRVLDAMGRHIKEEQSEEQDKAEESSMPPPRDVLLSRLRQGLNELVDDIDVMDKDDVLASDRSRIEELVATSKQARGVRKKLFSQSKKIVVPPPIVKPSFSWKMWLSLILAQVFLLCVMYRASLIQARNFLINAYYDPFNPERQLSLFKPDDIIHLPILDPLLALRDGDSWSTWFTSIDIAAYSSGLLSIDRNTWTPT